MIRSTFFNCFWGFTCLMASNSVLGQDVEALNNANRSLSWKEAVSIYQSLDVQHETAKLFEQGPTDIGKPLHLFVISTDQVFDPVEIRNQGKVILLINNGIHPGEPDGIDASVRLAQNILQGKNKLPSNVVLCIIPVYNIDGSLNSGCCTRANQNGPENQGFRGYARNLDLNREFIKCDSENAKSFTKIFRQWDPDVFIDTHVSNGADYQHVMTLISTQHNKLGGEAGAFIKNTMTPALFANMAKRGFPMAPYVNTRKYDSPPENGIYGFMETPRYASGYTALFNSLGFVTETHMLKPFPMRVSSTLALLEEFIRFSSDHAEKILDVRKATRLQFLNAETHVLDWKADTTQTAMIPFKGFEHYYQTSPVTGVDQLYYDRKKPFEKKIPFWDQYAPTLTVTVPSYYVLPQAWREVADRMRLNKVQMFRLTKDTVLELDSYVLGTFKTNSKPYEGHFVHSETEVRSEKIPVQLYAGDYFIPTNQNAMRYIVETMEPQAPDSWFSWGFFDSVLQQKEWFSGYVFDGMAAQILQKDPGLKSRFEAKRNAEPEFAKSAFEQLYFIYKNSEWFEDLYRFPIYKLPKGGHPQLFNWLK
ncbi:MAG: M14 family zinc carboxypeptidase [Bacteroidia bacterium]